MFREDPMAIAPRCFLENCFAGLSGVPLALKHLEKRKIAQVMSLDTHTRGGALREGPRGGFRALIRAGRRHRTEEEKERVKGPLQGGTTGNGALSDESVPQYRKPASSWTSCARGSLVRGLCFLSD